MNQETDNSKSWLNPSVLCRMDDNLIAIVKNPAEQGKIIMFACLVIIVCSALYGFSFGIWRSLEQALYSSAKMPILFFTTLMSGAVICTMLAQVMGAGLSFRTVCMTVLLGMAVASVIMSSLIPVTMFIVLQLPAADCQVKEAMQTYRLVLVLNVIIIGFSGIAGNGRLYRLLKSLTGSVSMALRLNVIWIMILGFVGCELSWLVSPFLARPDIPVPFFNPNAIKSNFFEYLWKAFAELIR